MSGAHEIVRSAKNPRLRDARAVLDGRVPDRIGLEGERLIADAVGAGVELETLFVAEGCSTTLTSAAREVVPVASGLLDRISRLETSPGLLALAATPPARSLEDLLLVPAAFLPVVCGVADPGNLGGIARSAEAAGATGFVVLTGGARPFADKALRGSMGSLLRLPVVYGVRADDVAVAFSRARVRSFSLETRGGGGLERLADGGALALWIGAETGAMPEVCASFEGVTIPMAGGIESLNVTVAASLAMFACGRVEGAR